MKNNLLKRLNILRKLSYLPGHYYSPVVMPKELTGRESEIFLVEKKDLPGIDLNEREQFKLLESISQFYAELPFKFEKSLGLRYYYNNSFFSYNSAIQLYGIIRHIKPRKIIEIGSGFSSALMLDTNDLFMNHAIKFTFIEPNPERLYNLLSEKDRKDNIILDRKIQDVDLNLFNDLQDNDILFIDSRHVSKTGSDLNRIIFEILPRLKEGVIIHFHDIFYPFEYPQHWVMQSGGFGWNENYLLHAFLKYNNEFKIILMNSYMEKFYHDWFLSHMPDCLKLQGGSIFITRCSKR